MKQFNNRVAVLALFLIAIILYAHHSSNAAASPSEINSANSPSWDIAPPGKKISNNTGVGANEPAIAAASNGDLMIVYNNWMTSSDDRDPYYSVSVNGGVTWSTPAPIYTSANVNSIQVDVAYSGNNNAHAVWSELVDDTPPLQTTSLFYSRYNGTSWTAPATLASLTSPLPLIGHPRIVAGNGYLDVVWEEGSPTVVGESGGNAVIMHTRSSNGGQNWSSPVQISSDQTTAPALTADVEIDASGRPHAIWRQSLPAGDSEIRYAEGNVNGGSVTWLPPINVSSVITNANQPELLITTDGRVHTSFTQSVIVGADSFDQWVYYTFCDQSCMSGANWSTPFNTIVEAVEVNDNSPFDVISDLAYGPNNCMYIFFHGLRDDTFGRELIWNVNSCDGWNPTEGWDPVTNDDTRAIFPRVVVSQGAIYITFQLVTNTSENSIYFMNGSFGPTGAFLPVVRKK